MKPLRIMNSAGCEFLLNPSCIVSVVETLSISYITFLASNSSRPEIISVPYGISEIEEKLAHAPTKMVRLPMYPDYQLLLNTDFFVMAQRVYDKTTNSFNSTNITLDCPFTENSVCHHPYAAMSFVEEAASKTGLLTYNISGDIDVIEKAFF